MFVHKGEKEWLLFVLLYELVFIVSLTKSRVTWEEGDLIEELLDQMCWACDHASKRLF